MQNTEKMSSITSAEILADFKEAQKALEAEIQDNTTVESE